MAACEHLKDKKKERGKTKQRSGSILSFMVNMVDSLVCLRATSIHNRKKIVYVWQFRSSEKRRECGACTNGSGALHGQLKGQPVEGELAHLQIYSSLASDRDETWPPTTRLYITNHIFFFLNSITIRHSGNV